MRPLPRPAGRIPPHRHPGEHTCIVLADMVHVAFGTDRVAAKGIAMLAGTVYVRAAGGARCVRSADDEVDCQQARIVPPARYVSLSA